MPASLDKAIEILYASMPYSSSIKEIDTSKAGAIYFSWRSRRLKYSYGSGMVHEIDREFETGTDTAILIQHIIKKHTDND